jgi:disulfide oxidoreductase YuzD
LNIALYSVGIEISPNLPSHELRFERLRIESSYNSSELIIIPEYIDGKAVYKELKTKLAQAGTVYEEKNSSAGRFLVYHKDTNHDRSLYLPYDYCMKNKNKGICLHTMTRDLTNTPNLEHWMKYYSQMGVDEFFFCINTFDNDILEHSVSRLKSLANMYKIAVYHLPLSHRYKPNFAQVEYAGDKDILIDFLRFAPSNFHHIQHIAIEISAYLSSYQWLLHCDTDEYIELNQNIMEVGSDTDVILFENVWACYLPLSSIKSSLKILTSDERIPAPVRSKYIARIANIEYFGIHYAKPRSGKIEISKKHMNHIWNLSERRLSRGYRLCNSGTEDRPKIPDGISYREMLNWRLIHL